MSYSPELSPTGYSDEDRDIVSTTVAQPTIKLKLKLNPYPSSTSATASDDKKKRKHKKKHKRKHKKSKHTDRDEEYHSYPVEEEDDEDDDDVEGEGTLNYHRPHAHVGGKRPFAMLQQQQQHQHQQQSQDYDNEHSDDSDTESYHPTDTKKSKREALYNSNHAPLHPVKAEDTSSQRRPSTTTTNKGRRSSSMKSNTTAANGEKPKKRGRPTNKAKAAAIIAQMAPKVPEVHKKDMKSILLKALDTIQKRDAYGFFLEPVNPKLVPDYLKIIKSPMDFSTMRKKLDSGQYKSVDEFRHDFNLIITNAKIYNAPETIYWKSADKIHDFGNKLIDRAEKQVEEEKLTAQPVVEEVDHSNIKRQDSFSSRKLSISFTGRKDSFGVKEEDVDIMGIDTNVPSLRKQSRQGSESIITREASVDIASSRAMTPIRSITSTPYKKKKKKVADTGVLYAPDGSLHIVGGVSDLSTLVPKDHSFAEPPQLLTSNPAALPSAFFINRNSADDFFHNKHFLHYAHFCDYGPFTTLGAQPPGAFYTAQDASYIYPLYGDDRGEAFMKSLWDFLDDDDDPILKEKVEERSNYLTRGAWNVVKQVLERKNENIDKDENNNDAEQPRQYTPVNTEFGPVDAAGIVDKIELKLKSTMITQPTEVTPSASS